MSVLATLLAATVSLTAATGGQPQKTLYAKGGATPTRLAWAYSGEQPVIALDYGGRTVGGYAVFTVKAFTPQGRDTDGNVVGYPVLRLSYATHPDGLSAKGCFTRRNCAHYLGPYFDNPVLPANVNRHETYTITHAGTYVAPLVQGQERYVRVQLETPGTSVELTPVEIRNVGVFATDPVVGSFRCSDERLNRVWDMCAWTCNLASFPNNDAWRVVAGRLLPRKLERGTAAGLCETATHAADGTWSIDFALSENPHHASAVGLLFGAADKQNGLVAVASQPAFVELLRLKDGRTSRLAKMVLDERLVDGTRHRLTVELKKGAAILSVDGIRILEEPVGALAGGRFGLYVEKEWWPEIFSYAVADAAGKPVFRDDFSKADADGRLAGWDYTRSFKFIADGAKRDRLVWIGDIWWADRTCYDAYGPKWPYLRESLDLFTYYQTPEGYVWASPFSEKGPRPGPREFGHFPSDEFSAWYVPLVRDYYLYTADERVRTHYYPAVAKCLGFLATHRRADGLYDQPIETSSNVASMAPQDTSIRFWTHAVFYKAHVDGAWLARRMGDTASAEKWEAEAKSLNAAIRATFRDPKSCLYRARLDSPFVWPPHGGLALGTGLATREEALAVAARLPTSGGSKVHLVSIRGAFDYGFDEKAFSMLENGTWLQLADPKWEGAQCCTECGFLTRNNWWDESHPDTAVSGDMTAYLLGVMPVEPGFSEFLFAPHVPRRLSFCEGKVPTPHGDIVARWARKDATLVASLTVPAGTSARFRTRLTKVVTLDGAPYVADAPIPPGRHAIIATGITEESFRDEALWATVPEKGEGWVQLPPFIGVENANPEAEFTAESDLGATMDLRAAELTAGPESHFPSRVVIEVSADGKTYSEAANLSGVKYPGHGKTLQIDLRTNGTELTARHVRFRYSHPPMRKAEYGDAWGNVILDGVRLRVGK